ncbi:MAG: DUF5778 family protein [Halobacteriaceae archaeon]
MRARETADDDAEFYEQVADLLRPGEEDLEGLVVHTAFTADEETEMYQATVEVGDLVAGFVTDETTFVYSGNDDPEFGLNQHQGRTVDGEEFVWECQQPLRDGSFDVVFYWRATGEHAAVVEAVREAGYDAVGVAEDGRLDA